MTDKDIDKIAQRVSDIVLAAMEERQAEYDEEFSKAIEIQEGSWKYVSPKKMEEITIDSLKELLSQALED